MAYQELRTDDLDDASAELAEEFPGIQFATKLSGYHKAETFIRGSDKLSEIAKEPQCKPWHPNMVGLTVCVYSFGDFKLDTGTFFCDFGIKIVWKQGAFEDDKRYTRQVDAIDVASGEVVKVQEPLVDIENCCSALEELQKRPNFVEEGLVNSFTRYQTTIKVVYNLRMFPFDMQALSIHVRLLSPKMAITRLRYHELKVLCKQPEWHVYPPYRAYTIGKATTHTQAGVDVELKSGKAALIFSLILQRRWQSYWFGIISLQWAVTSLSFTGFALPPSEFSSRSSVALTLILTSIAFKLYVSGSMPNVSYLTMCDSYTLGSFVLQVLIYAVQGFPILFVHGSHICTHLDTCIIDEKMQAMIDMYAFLLLIFIWVISNVAWHVMAYRHTSRSRQMCNSDPVFS